MKKRLAAVGLSVFMLSVSGFFSAALAAPACDRQLVMRIDTLKKSVEPDGISIDAFGVAESLGWKSPVLIVTGIAGGVANVDFTACRPEVSAQALTPIQVHQVLDLDLATTQRIIIRTRDNSMTVEISQ